MTADSVDINNNTEHLEECKDKVKSKEDSGTSEKTLTADSVSETPKGKGDDDVKLTASESVPKLHSKKLKTKPKESGGAFSEDKREKSENTDKYTQPQTANKSENTDHGKPSDDDDDNFGYYCNKCNGKFTDWKEMKIHKLDCVKIPRKHICSVCNQGFQQKCLLQQHFDFYHTKKPKKFVCVEHKKTYVYKKSLQEHQRHDYSDGDYKYMCDFCGKGFFHLGEFTIHRNSFHLDKRNYMCNRCQQRAFSLVGHLNAHLEKCGNPGSVECNICGKILGSKASLYTHNRLSS